MVFFSVVTIVKNNPFGFNKTKQSVDLQFFKDFEWIVVDGDVEPDNGIYDAMNKGVARAQGQYIVFINAGDQFASVTTLQDVHELCDGADIVYGDAIEDGHMKKAKSHDAIAQGLFTHHQSIYYNLNAVGDLRYDESYPIAADYKFTAQMMLSDPTVRYIAQALCVFETGGVSQINANQGRAEQRHIRQELGLWAPFTPLRQWFGHWIKSKCASLYWGIKKIDIVSGVIL